MKKILVVFAHPARTNEKELISKAKEARADLEKMFEEEKQLLESGSTPIQASYVKGLQSHQGRKAAAAIHHLCPNAR